jgi:hypothetical protein
VNPKELVVVGDERLVDRLTVDNLSILKKLNYKRIHGLSVEEILRDRVPIHGDHRISADWTFMQDLIVSSKKIYLKNMNDFNSFFSRV